MKYIKSQFLGLSMVVLYAGANENELTGAAQEVAMSLLSKVPRRTDCVWRGAEFINTLPFNQNIFVLKVQGIC